MYAQELVEERPPPGVIVAYVTIERLACLCKGEERQWIEESSDMREGLSGQVEQQAGA